MKQISICLVGCLPLLLNAPMALAAPPTPPGASILNAWTSLAPTATSSNVLLPASASTAPVVTIFNDSTLEAFVLMGTTNAVVAAANSVPIPPNRGLSLYVGANTYIAGISPGAGTVAAGALRILQGNGPIPYN